MLSVTYSNNIYDELVIPQLIAIYLIHFIQFSIPIQVFYVDDEG